MFLQRRKRYNEPLELRFSVASPRQWAKASVAPAKLIRNLDDEFATPQQLLREALFQMRGMNRVDLTCARRLKLCLVVQRRVWPTLNAALEALRKHDNGVPEPKSQQELLDLVDQMALALVAGYQIVIEGDYRPDDSHGRAQQARILEAGVRALEIVHLQQRLRALRYQPLPAASWQLANTLFCVMTRAENLETPVAAITADRTLLDTKGNTQALRLYNAIQRFGLFDTFSWCKPQQRFLDTYCANLPDGVSISYAVQPLSGPPPEPIADSESGALAAPLAKKAPDPGSPLCACASCWTASGDASSGQQASHCDRFQRAGRRGTRRQGGQQTRLQPPCRRCLGPPVWPVAPRAQTDDAVDAAESGAGTDVVDANTPRQGSRHRQSRCPATGFSPGTGRPVRGDQAAGPLRRHGQHSGRSGWRR